MKIGLSRPGFFNNGRRKNYNSRKKTQPLGATFLKFEKNKEKTHILAKFPGGTPKYAIFIYKHFQKRGEIDVCQKWY